MPVYDRRLTTGELRAPPGVRCGAEPRSQKYKPVRPTGVIASPAGLLSVNGADSCQLTSLGHVRTSQLGGLFLRRQPDSVQSRSGGGSRRCSLSPPAQCASDSWAAKVAVNYQRTRVLVIRTRTRMTHRSCLMSADGRRRRNFHAIATALGDPGCTHPMGPASRARSSVAVGHVGITQVTRHAT